jgi:hypothetical protein
MSAARNAGVAALVAVLVVAAAAAGGAVLTSPEPTPEQTVQPASFQPEESLVAPDDPEGEVSVGGAEPKVVLIDAAHANGFEDGQLEGMVDALTAAGHTVRLVGAEAARNPQAFNQSLRAADALVVINPEQPYTDAQRAGVEAFTDAGGRLLLVQDPQASAPTLFFGPPRSAGGPLPMSALASAHGISFRTGYVYDMTDNDDNYRNVYATPAGGSGLTEGVSRTVFRDARPVRAAEGSRLVTTADTAELSTTRDAGQYALAVRSGNVVAMGSLAPLTPTWRRTADNEVLVGNLLTFLVTGDKRPENAPAPATPERGPSGPDRPPRPPANVVPV